MEEKKLKTTEAQRRASIKWQKENYSRIPLDVPKEYHLYLKEKAKADGKTLGAWIKEAIELKAGFNEGEIMPEVVSKAIDWLENHGHNEEDVLDFLKCLK